MIERRRGLRSKKGKVAQRSIGCVSLSDRKKMSLTLRAPRGEPEPESRMGLRTTLFRIGDFFDAHGEAIIDDDYLAASETDALNHQIDRFVKRPIQFQNGAHAESQYVGNGEGNAAQLAGDGDTHIEQSVERRGTDGLRARSRRQGGEVGDARNHVRPA